MIEVVGSEDVVYSLRGNHDVDLDSPFEFAKAQEPPHTALGCGTRELFTAVHIMLYQLFTTCFTRWSQHALRAVHNMFNELGSLLQFLSYRFS
jgi:hypothetical protein